MTPRKFDITYAETIDTHTVSNRSLTFKEFIQLLENDTKISETKGMTDTQLDILKRNHSYFIPSKIDCKTVKERLKQNVISRSMLSFDIDGSDIEFDDMYNRVMKLGYDFLMYTTFNHIVKDNRYRVMIPLLKDITGTVEDIESITKAITKSIGAELDVTEYLDSASWVISQAMFTPHYQKDINEGAVIHESEGKYLDFIDYIDVDKVLTHTVSNNATTEHIEGVEIGNNLRTDEIIFKIMKSKQADDFEKLYLGEGLDLECEDQSSLDMSLANILAWWTNGDIDKMDRLFRDSKLMRDKWDRKTGTSTYGRDTLIKAVNRVDVGYTDKDDTLPSWIEELSKGRKRLITGVLAEHLAQNIDAKHTANRFFIYENGIYNECEDSEEQTVVMDLIPTEVRTTGAILDTVNQWSIHKGMRISPNDWNNNPYMINLENGIYDIKEHKLIDHSPKYLDTVRINASYNPNAVGTEWDKFIERVVPDPTYRLIVQEILGYSLTSFNNIKKMFILDGESNTGKSVYLNTIQYLLGDRNVSNIELQSLSERFNKVHLYGKIANIFGDLPTTPIKENLFKALTGDDSINAERKGQEGFSFRSKAKLLFSCNGLPSNYGDTSSAFYGRLMIIPFNEVIPLEEQDPMLKEKLEAESDYILQWGLEGLNRVIDNDFKFTHSEDMENRVTEYRKEGNVVMQFLDEDMIVTTNDKNIDDKHIPKSDLYPLYETYCFREKHNQVLGKLNFNKEMKRLGYKEGKRGTKQCWLNIYPNHWIDENRVRQSKDPIELSYRRNK